MKWETSREEERLKRHVKEKKKKKKKRQMWTWLYPFLISQGLPSCCGTGELMRRLLKSLGDFAHLMPTDPIYPGHHQTQFWNGGKLEVFPVNTQSNHRKICTTAAFKKETLFSFLSSSHFQDILHSYIPCIKAFCIYSFFYSYRRSNCPKSEVYH